MRVSRPAVMRIHDNLLSLAGQGPSWERMGARMIVELLDRLEDAERRAQLLRADP